MNWIPLLLSLLGGAGAGNAVGKFLKEKGLGPVANTVLGALGGAGGGAIAQMLGLGGHEGAAAASSGTDAMAMIGNLIGGGAGGGALTAVVGMIKSAMTKTA